MTIYRQLQQQMLDYDSAVEEQSEQLVAAATGLAKHLPKYLGVHDQSFVKLGVGVEDQFEPGSLEESDCSADGAGEIDFTIRIKVLPNNDPGYQWLNDLPMRISLAADSYKFEIFSQGLVRASTTLKPVEVQNGAFAPVYNQMVEVLIDNFDPSKILRIG